MKHTALAAGLLALLGTGALGCKSAPQLAWWKGNKSAESTAVAHSAPQLPSDAAKQAQLNSAQLAGGQAAPFVAGQTAKSVGTVAPTGYPSTDAPAFSPSVAGQLAGAANAGTARQASSANLGSIAMPYDPKATPQAAVASAATPTTPAGDDRYGALALAGVAPNTAAAGSAYGQASQALAGVAGAQKSATDIISSAPVYSDYAAGSRYNVAAAAPQNTVPTAAPGATTNPGGLDSAALAAAPSYQPSRYGDAVTPAGATTTVPPADAPPVNVAVATAQPYRPGGTGSYPATVRVATRPTETTAPTYNNPSVPNVALPSAYATPVAPQTPTQYR